MSNYRHGERRTRLYICWMGMKQRCLNPKAANFKWYGGRGLTICDAWHEFIPFRDWARSNGYDSHLELDRKKNNIGYYPGNCRWITHAENCRNRRKRREDL